MSTPDGGTGVGRAIGAGPDRDQPDAARPRQLADEQAALRRVATLVAGGARPAEVFSAVADELGQLIGVEATFVSRVDLLSVGPPGATVADPSGERAEPEGYVTVAGSYGRIRDEVPVGFRVKLSPGMVMTVALRTGRPAQMRADRWLGQPHPIRHDPAAETLRGHRVRARCDRAGSRCQCRPPSGRRSGRAGR